MTTGLSPAYMITPSGARFDLLDPNPKDVHLRDIAYALSRINRFNGCTQGAPYSVAQHSLLVCDLTWRASEPKRDFISQWALLHDAHEAYIGDIIWGVCRLMRPEIDRLKWKVDMAIIAAFGLRLDEIQACRELVKTADMQAKKAEFKFLMPQAPREEWWEDFHMEDRIAPIEPWSARQAEIEFIQRALALGIPDA